MENEEKTVIEINGVKLEVDLRNAKVIENYRVGDNVRVLVKEYGDKYKVFPGVIVGFDMFENLPTITIAYIDVSYSGADVKFVYLNEKNENEVELAPAHEIEDIRFKKSDVLGKFNGEIEKKKEEIKDIERKVKYFEECFAKYFKTEPVK